MDLMFEEDTQWETWVVKLMEEMERKESKRLKTRENQPKKKKLLLE